jgi:phosphate transport system substrate-binding protein
MNDEFLHRLRKTPPPEFLAGLKARLDRQPVAPPPRRRWTFTRGLLAGLMLGGAAFAITAVSLTGGRPDSLRSFVSAPLRAMARLMPGGGAGDGEHPERDSHLHAMPLGPVWLPNHPAAGAPAGQPKVPTASASLAAQGNGVSNSSADAATSRWPGPPSRGSGLSEFPNLRVLTASGMYPLVSQAAEKATNAYPGRIKIKINIEIGTGIGNPFNRMCLYDTADVDVIELTRRITREEYDGCNARRNNGVVEVKLGYQALALARGRLYGPLKLSARDLFLGLARQIPDPNRAEGLINNPYATWNQVDGSLPYDPIQILGPATGSTPARLVAQLLLEPGCNTYSWIAALRQSDPDRYKEICGTLREDSAYVTSGTAGWNFTNFLATNPTAIGIFSLNDLRLSHDGLVLNPIDGIEPDTSNIANGSYPAARPLYLYVRALGPQGNQGLMTFVGANLAPKDLYGRDPDGWGFVALDQAQIDTGIAITRDRRELKF